MYCSHEILVVTTLLTPSSYHISGLNYLSLNFFLYINCLRRKCRHRTNTWIILRSFYLRCVGQYNFQNRFSPTMLSCQLSNLWQILLFPTFPFHFTIISFHFFSSPFHSCCWSSLFLLLLIGNPLCLFFLIRASSLFFSSFDTCWKIIFKAKALVFFQLFK